MEAEGSIGEMAREEILSVTSIRRMRSVIDSIFRF
jgi:hypothetical protein